MHPPPTLQQTLTPLSPTLTPPPPPTHTVQHPPLLALEHLVDVVEHGTEVGGCLAVLTVRVVLAHDGVVGCSTGTAALACAPCSKLGTASNTLRDIVNAEACANCITEDKQIHFRLNRSP